MASRIPQDDLRIGLLGDGADWLWKHMVACFPEGRQILDYYRCAEHIHKVAKLQYDEKSSKCLEWVESTMTRLFYAEVDDVIWVQFFLSPIHFSIFLSIQSMSWKLCRLFALQEKILIQKLRLPARSIMNIVDKCIPIIVYLNAA